LSRRAQNGRDRRARSRKQLVEAARALFSVPPLESVTVEEVASAAGLAKGTFYAHFQSLDELWAALAKDLAREMAQSLEPVTSRCADPLERIAVGCAAFIERAFGDPAWGALAARGIWTFPDVSDAARLRFAEDLREAERQGRLHTLSPEVGFDLVVGAVSQAMRSASEGKLAPSEATSIVAVTIRSLGAPAEQADRITAKLALSPPEGAARDASNADVGKDLSNQARYKQWQPISSASNSTEPSVGAS
jgi:AcrR family transcriptional regulator